MSGQEQKQEQDPDFEQALDQLADDGQQQIKEEDQHAQLTDLEQEAVSGGWTTKTQWEDDGKDPARHKSAHEFVEYGKINTALNATKQQMDQMRADTDARIGNLNKLHEQQREADKAALRAEQRTAVDNADTDAYDAAQTKIDAIDAAPAPATNTSTEAPAQDPAIVAYEAKNPWAKDSTDARTIAANAHMQAYVTKNPNATTAEAVDYADGQIKAMTQQPGNSRRDNPTGYERSGGGGRQRSGGKLSMSDLTQQERQDWNKMGFDIFGNDEKAFLQAVADSRKAQ